MVSEPPSCRQCGGKFGRILLPPYCELCGQLAQLTTHLYSKRFPAVLGHIAEGAIREALHRCLSSSDCFWGAEEAKKEREVAAPQGDSGKPVGGTDPPGAENVLPPEGAPEVKKEEGRSTQPLPGLTGKASSPCRPLSPEGGRGSKVKTEDSTPGKESKSSAGEPRKRSKHRKRKKRSRSGSRRSHSRRRRRGEDHGERVGSPRFEEIEEEPEPPRRPIRPSSAHSGHAEGRRVRSPSRSLAKRDYSGYYQQPSWTGPIPSGENRRREEGRGRSPRAPVNKGVKKRKQQEKARAFGGWNNRGGRGWQRR